MQAQQSELQNFLGKVKSISGRLTYPISDSAQLVKQLGGSQATIQWEGATHRVDQAAGIIPAYYFPIESEEDFSVKAVNLELIRPGSPLAQTPMAAPLKSLPVQSSPPGPIQNYPPPAAAKAIKGGPAIVIGIGRK